MKKTFIKEKVGQYTRIKDFTFANKRMQMKRKSGEKAD